MNCKAPRAAEEFSPVRQCCWVEKKQISPTSPRGAAENWLPGSPHRRQIEIHPNLRPHRRYRMHRRRIRIKRFRRKLHPNRRTRQLAPALTAQILRLTREPRRLDYFVLHDHLYINISPKVRRPKRKSRRRPRAITHRLLNQRPIRFREEYLDVDDNVLFLPAMFFRRLLRAITGAAIFRLQNRQRERRQKLHGRHKRPTIRLAQMLFILFQKSRHLLVTPLPEKISLPDSLIRKRRIKRKQRRRRKQSGKQQCGKDTPRLGHGRAPVT